MVSREATAISPEPIMRMIFGAHVAAILRTAVRLRIFDAIGAGATDIRTIATATGLDERGARVLLDALVALRLLTKHVDYELSPLADKYLVSTRTAYVGGSVEILTGAPIWAGMGRLEEAVRAGGSILDEPAETPEHGFWELFARASSNSAKSDALQLERAIGSWLRERESVAILDAACGSGLYSLMLAQHHRHVTVSLLDWPNVLKITRATVEELGLLERTCFLEGDVRSVPLDGPYDLIVASHLLHHFSRDICVDLLRRLGSALATGGRLVINEVAARHADPAAEPVPRLFAVLMLAWTREGEPYSLDEYQRMLADAGFERPDVIDGAAVPSTRFLIAQRSDAWACRSGAC